MYDYARRFHLFLARMRTYEEHERADPVTTGVGDAPREKTVKAPCITVHLLKAPAVAGASPSQALVAWTVIKFRKICATSARVTDPFGLSVLLP